MGLALQEVYLILHYQPGRTNEAADSLSRFPVMESSSHDTCVEEPQVLTIRRNDFQEGGW